MVFLKNLNKEVFPCFIKPEENELFSSWLCRLSYNHNIKTNTFIQNYFGRNTPFWNRDIDVLAPRYIIEFIEKHSPLLMEDINKMFIKSFEGYAFDKFRPSGTIRNILPLGINHRKRKQFGQQCCTNCLSKEVTYYQKNWRLISSVICTKCKYILIDRCYTCGAPITFFRVNIKSDSNLSTMEFQPLYLCSNCHADLRKHVPKRAPTLLEIEYQEYIDKTIQLGYNNITQYSFTYIRVLLLLALRLRSKSRYNRFRELTIKEFQVPDEFIDKEIRYWSIDQRIETFPLIYMILKDFPKSISNLVVNSKTIKSYLVKDNDYIPYWFEKILYY